MCTISKHPQVSVSKRRVFYSTNSNRVLLGATCRMRSLVARRSMLDVRRSTLDGMVRLSLVKYTYIHTYISIYFVPTELLRWVLRVGWISFSLQVAGTRVRWNIRLRTHYQPPFGSRTLPGMHTHTIHPVIRRTRWWTFLFPRSAPVHPFRTPSIPPCILFVFVLASPPTLA